MPHRPENPDRPLTPYDVARGLQRSGNDPDMVRRNLAKVRAALEQSGARADASDSPPEGISAAEWEEYLVLQDDERRRNEGYEAENPPSV